MSKISNYVGVAVGVLIIIFSIVVFNLDTVMHTDDPEKIPTITEAQEAPESESNSYYGGDAYTGIQQASAQTANNLIPVYYSILQTNENTSALNETIGVQMKSDAKNMEKAVSAITTCFGFLLLAIGLLTLLKYASTINFKASCASFAKKHVESSEVIPTVQPEEAVFVNDTEELLTM